MKRSVCLGALLLSGSAFGQVWDFETLSLGAAFTVVDNSQAVSLTATGATFGDYVHVGDRTGFTATFGTRSLIANALDPMEFDEFQIIKLEFGSLMSQVSVQAADGGGDDDGNATLKAYDASDNLLGSHTLDADVGSDVITLTVAAGGIKYVTVETDAAVNTHSLWVDNVRATVVPEPATMAALGLGAAALLRRRRNA